MDGNRHNDLISLLEPETSGAREAERRRKRKGDARGFLCNLSFKPNFMRKIFVRSSRMRSTSRKAFFVVCVASFAALAALPLRADEGEVPSAEATRLRRYELAGFPILGGNSDIGVQFGGAATLTRFYDRAFPYLWNADLLLSASLKDVNGIRLVQQSHVLRLDAPDLLDGRLRVDTRANFQHTINSGYYGIGNLAPVDPAKVGNKHYWYTNDESRLRVLARIHTGHLIDVALGTIFRYEAPELYYPSRLADDLAGPHGSATTALGATSMFLAGIGAGIMMDTRDSEFVTRRGIFYQIGAGATVGSADAVGYGNASAVLSNYAPIGPLFVFASRFVASFQFGRVPFYDLAQAGTFEPQYLLGSESGVRGVPEGRYRGPVMMATNLEIRGTPFPRFRLFGERFRIGTTTFFDAGRTWSDYSVISPADGTLIGLRFGVGGGAFLQWGEAAIFRVEVAYSPDAVSENPNLPIGIYVADGMMF